MKFYSFPGLTTERCSRHYYSRGQPKPTKNNRSYAGSPEVIGIDSNTRKEDVHQISVGFNEPLAQKLPFKEVYLKILAKHPNKLCKILKNSAIDSFSSALSDPTVLKTFNEPLPLNKFKDTDLKRQFMIMTNLGNLSSPICLASSVAAARLRSASAQLSRLGAPSGLKAELS